MLIDFNLAEKGEYLKEHCGTHGYLPPETFAKNEPRGSPGDIWALGVTVLWILGKIEEPEPEPTYDDIKRLKDIYSKRDQLDLTNEIEGLVFKMLEQKSEARIKAADIERALKGGLSGNKRKYN